MQQLEAVCVELVEVDLGGIGAEIDGVALLSGEDALFDQGFQADHVGVASESGESLIGRIVGAAVAGGAQGQDLPVLLTGIFQPVHEVIGSLVEAADAVLGGQAGNGQQYAGISFHGSISFN